MWYNKTMKNYQYRNNKNNLILKLIDIVKKNPEKTISRNAVRLAVPSAALPHALRKTVMGTAVPMEIKTPGTIAGPVRSALFRTARQQ